jgi:tetratricopeptide (TPR) repeat protein
MSVALLFIPAERLAAGASTRIDTPDYPQGRRPAFDVKAENFYERGRLLIADKQWAKAVDAFNQAIVLDAGAKYIDEAFYYLAFALKKLNRLKEADETLERLITKYPGSDWAKDARAMQLEIAPELGRVDGLARESRTTQNEEVRLAALLSLFAADPAQAREVALEILNTASNSNSRLKVGVLTILRNVEDDDKRITSRLIDLVANETDVETRKAAINALWRNNEDRVLRLFKDVAVRSDNPDLSEAVLVVLGRQVSDRTDELLVEIAVSAPSLEARKSALSKLGIRPGDAILDQLMSVVENTGGDLETKQHALSLVGLRLATSAHSRSLLARVARENSDEELRKLAIKLIGLLNNSETVGLLISFYDSESSLPVKRAILVALWKLSQIDNREAREKLMDVAARDRSIELRTEAKSLLENTTIRK